MSNETTPMGGHDEHNPFINRHTYVRQHVDSAHTSSMVFAGKHRLTVDRKGWGDPVMSVAYLSRTGRHQAGPASSNARDEQIDQVAVGGLQLADTLSKMLQQVMACRFCRGTGDCEGEVCACRTKAAAMLHQLPSWFAQASRILDLE